MQSFGFFQEMILDTVEGKNVPRYLVYDIIRFEASDISIKSQWYFMYPVGIIHQDS